MIELPDINSTLIKSISYDELKAEITIRFKKYFVDELTYVDFDYEYFEKLLDQLSVGKFYLNFIKPNFKLKNNYMAQPKGINKAKKEKRFIQMRINVTAFNKDYFFQGEKGTYADITLHLAPDGETDQYGNLGMITQDIPYKLKKEDKNLRGAILGNGRESDWNAQASEGQPGTTENLTAYEPADNGADDLPF